MRIHTYLPTDAGDPQISPLRRASVILQKLLTDGTAAPVIISSVLIPEPPPRWRSFGVSSLLVALLVVCATIVPILFPEKFEPVRRYLVTALSRPPAPVRKFEIRKPAIPTRLLVSPSPSPEVAQSTPAPRVYLPAKTSPAKAVLARPKETPVLLTNVSDPVTSPAQLPVQTAAFPNLVKPRDGVRTGVFETDGAGYGQSGHGGQGHAGFVTTGFLTGTGDGRGKGQGLGCVPSSSTRSAVEPCPEAAGNGQPTFTPVKILVKPTPVYTPAARNKKVEGDVILRVVFRSTGTVETGDVVRGLGFGLDESAQNAAKMIQFQPAQKNGVDVDFPAVVHISFQLAE
jgi:TonB family protein